MRSLKMSNSAECNDCEVYVTNSTVERVARFCKCAHSLNIIYFVYLAYLILNILALELTHSSCILFVIRA